MTTLVSCTPASALGSMILSILDFTGPAVPYLGRGLVLLALFSATFGAVIGFAAGIRKDHRLTRIATLMGGLFAVFMLAANALMVVALLHPNFAVSYVAEVGSIQTPVYFQIVSLWASLSGSILLWGGVLGLYVIAMILAIGNKHPDYLPWSLGTLLVICVFFAMLVSSVADPFQPTPADHIQEMCLMYGCANGLPLDGPGPNPLLQNHWLMAFHPPTLYLGYVGMAAPFAMICAALFAGRLESGWMTPLRRMFLLPWAFLTAGIIMGGWWSFAVLGWGGFWAWDPVENASFMPWLTGTAFLHSAMMMQRRESMKTWTLILGMVTFLLTLFGTFLTRSGVFNSVHAFAEGPVGPIFLGFIAVSLVFCVVLLSLREHTLYSLNGLPTLSRRRLPAVQNVSQRTVILGAVLVLVFTLGPALAISMTLIDSLPVAFALPFPFTMPRTLAWLWLPLVLVIPAFFLATKNRHLGRELTIVLQNFAFTLFTFVVFIGTVYPILSEALRGDEGKVSVGEPYFDKFAFPIGMILVVLMGIGPALPWGRASVSRAWTRFAVPLIGAGLTGVLWVFRGGIQQQPGIEDPGLWFGFQTLGNYLSCSVSTTCELQFSGVYTTLALSLCVFALLAGFNEYLLPVWARFRGKKETPIVAAWQVARKGRRRWGGHIAHMGMIMAVFSMAMAKGYRQEQYFTTGPGQDHEFAEYTITFEDIEILPEGFRESRIGKFRVSKQGKDLGLFEPRINTYKTRPGMPLPAPTSRVTPTHTLQLSLMSVEKDGSFAYLRVIRMPYMVWLWIAAAVMFFGTMIAIWPSATRRPQSTRKPDEKNEGHAA